MGWTCSRCGREHEGIPRDWAYDEPTYWDGGRSEDDQLTTDICRWTDDDGRVNYFIRGILTLPVVDDAEDDFRYGLWSSLSETSYERIVELWDEPERTREPAYFGWLSNALPGYPQTLSLALDVITSELDLRPEFVLHDADHPLVREQREGITVARVREIAELNFHPG